MFFPCGQCYMRGGAQYTEECDTTCDYAKVVKENKEMLMKIARAIATVDICGDDACPAKNGCEVYSDKECIDRIMSWLKSVVEC